MKRIFAIIAAALLLVLPPAALAKGKGPIYIPPNQSAASQYTEDVPTAGGNTPTKDVHHAHGSTPSSGGSGGSGPGDASGSNDVNAEGGASIPSSTIKAMSRNGSAGAAAASLAQALAPTVRPTASPKTRPTSATGQLVKTLSGSDASGGVGVLLPILLVGSLVFASGLGLTRFRRPHTAS